MNKSNKTFIMACLILTVLLIGCDSKEVIKINNNYNISTAVPTFTNEPIIKTEKYNVKIELENYKMPGVFSMDKPKGWGVHKAGDYNTLAFLTRDENNPLRQAFMFGEIGIFYVDKNLQNTERYYHNNGGYRVPWIDMPLVSPFNGTNFIKKFYKILNSNIGKQYLGSANMPIPTGLKDIKVLYEKRINSLFPGMSTFLVRAILVYKGKVAQGMFALSTYKDAYGHGSAYLVSGITAPANEYISVKDSLLSTIRSFKMEDSYVNAGINVINENGERFQQISKTISETSDIIIDGWNERNRSFDVRIGKKSDQIMGVERVYDTDSDEVYEVENGFYDYYATHQDQYQQKNLQPLQDDNYSLWEKAPIINHSLVMP